MSTEDTPGNVPLSEGLGGTKTRPLPRGEVMATGTINGLRVELVRYTEDEIRTRDRQWEYDVQRERDTAMRERCHRINLELDLRRLMDGEPTLNDFELIAELRMHFTGGGAASHHTAPVNTPDVRPVCMRCGYTVCHVECGAEDYEASVLPPNARLSGPERPAQEDR